MREIKFKAWDKLSRKIVNVKKLDLLRGNVGLGWNEYDGVIWRDIKDVVLMQYTGLKDKNSKEIYEGDIIKLGNGDICVIKHNTDNNRCSMFIAEPINKYPSAIRYEWFTASNCEVIGNVYEKGDIK